MVEITEKTSTGMKPNVAGLLCYLVGWVTGLIFLLIEKDSKFVRFHAIQSIGFSICIVILWVIAVVLAFIPILGWIVDFLIWIGIVVLWIVLMVKAYQGHMFKLPIVGKFAEKNSQPAAK
jgi:uncharacterized membrane protein